MKGFAIHRKAMEFAEEALRAKRAGDMWAFQNFSNLAFELEWEFAQLKEHGYQDRAVFSRSAAWLAIHAKRYADAQKAIDFGLSGKCVAEEFIAELQEAQTTLTHLMEAKNV